MKILDRYVLRAIIASVGLVIAVFLVLGALFLFTGQQDDIGVGSYSAADAILYVFLNLPEQAWQLLPITATIGSLVGLGTLMRGSELTIMRGAGWSVWRIARTAVLAGVLLAVCGGLIGELLAPPMAQLARQNKAFGKFSDVNLAGPAGAWQRDGRRFVNVDRQSGDRRFGGVLIVELDDNHRLRTLARAASATASAANPQRWMLAQYAETSFDGSGRVAARTPSVRLLQTGISADFLGVAATSPGQMPARTLWSLIGYLERNGLDSRAWVFAFWSRIARLAAIVFAVLLAVPFVFGSLRSVGGGSRAVAGVAIGVGFFLLQSLLENGALVFDLDPKFLAWLPTALLGIAALGLTATTR